MARPTPVFPEVGSMIVPPGRSSPQASAASTMRSAIRSFTEPPGLKYSTLATTAGASAPSSRVTRRSRTSGVLPTSSISESWTCITSHLPYGAGPGTALSLPVLLHRRYPTSGALRPASAPTPLRDRPPPAPAPPHDRRFPHLPLLTIAASAPTLLVIARLPAPTLLVIMRWAGNNLRGRGANVSY